MTTTAPGSPMGYRDKWSEGDELALVDVTLTVPEMPIPPLPWRQPKSHRVFFPTGTWRTWLTGADATVLLDRGGRIEKLHRAMRFFACDDLRNYAENIYDLRKRAASDAESNCLKVLLNSLYGKFAESEEKAKILIHPTANDVARLSATYVSPGVYEVEEEVRVEHRHVPFSAHITAVARRTLLDHMMLAPDVFYVDTDALSVPSSYKLPTGRNLGELKLEKHIRDGRFVAPKLYAYRETADGEWTIKAKGFSKVQGKRNEAGEWEDDGKDAHRLTYEDFCSLVDGKEVYLDQFLRIKSLVKMDEPKPTERLQAKRLRGNLRPKRRKVDSVNGSTAPWDVSELTTDEMHDP